MSDSSSGGGRSYLALVERFREIDDLPLDKRMLELLRLLGDRKHQWVRQRAAKRLGDLEARDAVPSLIECFEWSCGAPPERDRGCTVREAVVDALGAIGDERSVPVVRRALRLVQIERLPVAVDTAVSLRCSAATALARLAPVGAVYDLTWLLYDREPNAPVPPQEVPFAKAPCRRAAAKALAYLGDPAGAVALVGKLSHPAGEASEVLADCMDSLTVLGCPVLVETLAPFLTGDEAYLAATSAHALAQGLKGGALPLLKRSIEACASDEARVSLVAAMASVRDPETPAFLTDLLDSPHCAVRLGALEGLALFEFKGLLDRLPSIARTDESGVVRRAAEELLGRMSTRPGE